MTFNEGTLQSDVEYIFKRLNVNPKKGGEKYIEKRKDYSGS